MAKRSQPTPEPAPDSNAEAEAIARVKPRHELLGVKAGMPGYRKRCRCDKCRGANAAYQREARARKKREAAGDTAAPVVVVNEPDDIEFIARYKSLLDLPEGAVSRALAADLKKVDGAYVFGETVSTMALISARLMDNAIPIGNLDMVSKMQIRLLDALKRLEPPRAGAQRGGADKVEKFLSDLMQPESTGK